MTLDRLIPAARTGTLTAELLDAALSERTQSYIDTRMEDLDLAFHEAGEEPPPHSGMQCGRCADEVNELWEGLKEIYMDGDIEYTDDDLDTITDFWAGTVADNCPALPGGFMQSARL